MVYAGREVDWENIFPRLLFEWNTELNEGRSLSEFTRASNHKGIWTCKDCGHIWPASLSNRTRLGSNCPKCGHARRAARIKGKSKPVLPEKSLTFRFPELAKFWHPTKNELSSREVGLSVPFLSWWLCNRGHDTQASLGSKVYAFKTKGYFACQTCYLEDKRKPTPGRSLAERQPEVAARWHPTKNGELTPADVYAHANTYAWWQCEEGHDTYALINSKSQGFDCVDCSGSTSKVEADMKAAFVAHSAFKVSDEVKIDLRWRKQHTARIDVLATHGGKLVAIEYDGEYYHGKSDKIEIDLAKTEALLKAGYYVVRIRERELPHLNLHHERLLQTSFHFKRSAQTKDTSHLPVLVAEWLNSR